MLKKSKNTIAPEYSFLLPWITQLPENFAGTGETIYKLRNEIKVFVVRDLRLNVKEFKVPVFFNRIIYLYFRGSKAARSFKYAQLLTSLGIQTPTPVGYVDCAENGLLTKCFYVSLQLEYNYTLREALQFQSDIKRAILKEWVRFTYLKLHANGIFHLDYSPGNILITEKNGTFEFSIVDLNRMTFGPISYEKGLSNLCRLEIDTESLELMGCEYAALRSEDTAGAAKLIVDIYQNGDRSQKRQQVIKRILKGIFRFGLDEK